MSEVGDAPKGSIYTHSVRGQPLTIVRGHVPVEKLIERVLEEEKGALRESSDLIQRLLTEGGAVTSSGKLVAVGIDAIPMSNLAKRRVSKESIMSVNENHARKNYGLQTTGPIRGPQKVFFLREGLISEMRMVYFTVDSVGLRPIFPHRP